MKPLKLALAGTLLSSSLFLQGCTDEQIGTGIGVVIGGVIGHELGKGRDDRRYDDRYNRGDRYDRHDRRDRRDDRYGWRSGRGYRPYSTFSMSAESESQYSDAAVTVADKYDIALGSAEVLVDSLARGEQGDLSGLMEMGLQKSDLINIYENKPISVEALVTMSKALNMEVRDTALLFLKIKEDVQTQRSQLVYE